MQYSIQNYYNIFITKITSKGFVAKTYFVDAVAVAAENGFLQCILFIYL